MNELIRKTALELADLIRKKEVSSREVVEAHLTRIKEVNPEINAITIVLEDSALKQADKADESLNVDTSGPFHGVPITIKENIDFVGTPTTNGLSLLADSMPPRNTPLVDRILKAGAIPIGRTNMPEMGMRLDTDNPLRGRTFNPWNKENTPGGSSGGEGAAIATGMSPFGIGNDIGGSLRNPAYCCGITALKPSIGRIPFVRTIAPFEDIGISGAFLSDGPMARSVKDLKMGLSIMSGRHIDDPQSIDCPLEGDIPDKPKVALIKQVSDIKLPEATIREIDKAGEILKSKGWQVDEVEAPEVERVYEIWGSILNHGLLDVLPEEIFKPETAAYLKRFSEATSEDIALDEALLERRRLRRSWSAFLTDYTVCVGPTWSNLQWPIDTDLNPELGDEVLRKSFMFIAPGNCLGIPSVALPMGIDNGLPTGIQIYSELYREDLCLHAAELIQNEVPCPTPIDPKR